MNAQRPMSLKASAEPGKASAEDGVVLLDGPDGVAVTMTAEAAVRTAASLQEAAEQILKRMPGQPLAMARVLPGMARGIVIALDPVRRLFAVQAEDGACAVFCQHAGPQIQPGDILEGPVVSRGARILGHVQGMCAAVGDSGPVTREQALAWVHGSSAP